MRKVLFLVMLLACVCANGQSVQKGIVYEYHGREDKTPLAGVVINAGGATAKSNAHGNFKLSFNNLKVGDRVAADPDNCALLKNYIVFNIDAVQQWNVSSAGNMFAIVLCRKDKFDKMVMTYYNASDKSLKQQLKREQERAKQAWKEQQIQKAEYEQLLEEANQRYQQATESMQQNAELVARIDESELEGNQAEILELARQGRMDEAVVLIRQDSTTVLLERAAKKRDYVAEQEQYYKDKRDEANSEVAKLIARLKDNIKVLQLAGGKENYDLCVEYWKKIVEADTTNMINLWNASEFFNRQFRLELAEKTYKMRLNGYRKLYESNPDKYVDDYLAVLNSLGLFCKDRKRYAEAEEYYTEALELLDSLRKSNSYYNKEYALSMNNLGTMYRDLGQFEKAERNYLMAYEIRKEYYKADSIEDPHFISQTLFDLGYVYNELKQYEKSEMYYLQSLSMRKELSDKYEKMVGPQYKGTFLLPYVDVLHYIAVMYHNKGEDDKAESYYLQALSNERDLAFSNPDAVGADYVQTVIDFAGFCVEANRLDHRLDQTKTMREYILEELQTLEEKGVIPEERKGDVERLRGVLR